MKGGKPLKLLSPFFQTSTSDLILRIIILNCAKIKMMISCHQLKKDKKKDYHLPGKAVPPKRVDIQFLPLIKVFQLKIVLQRKVRILLKIIALLKRGEIDQADMVLMPSLV
jgi:hypothetical protein